MTYGIHADGNDLVKIIFEICLADKFEQFFQQIEASVGRNYSNESRLIWMHYFSGNAVGLSRQSKE